MKKLYVALILTCLMFFLVVNNCNAQQNLRIIGSGTGFFIRQDLIVTNAHVVSKGREIHIVYNGQNIPVSIVANAAPVLDLALLRLPYRVNVQPLKVGLVPDDGEKVFTIGYPMPNVLETTAKISEGIINGSLPQQMLIQISIPIQPGNSGSPVFDDRGFVLGVVSSGWRDGVAENLNFAITSVGLTYFLQSAGLKNHVGGYHNLVQDYLDLGNNKALQDRFLYSLGQDYERRYPEFSARTLMYEHGQAVVLIIVRG